MNPTIYSMSGCEVVLLGRKSASVVFARRVCDGVIRTYFNGQLRAEGGAQQIQAALQVLPKTTLEKIREQNL